MSKLLWMVLIINTCHILKYAGLITKERKNVKYSIRRQ
jgi:hypothetical protein